MPQGRRKRDAPGPFLNVIGPFPTVLFTAALVVVIGFRLMVLLGAAVHDGFDADVDTDAPSLGGVPVSVSVRKRARDR